MCMMSLLSVVLGNIGRVVGSQSSVLSEMQRELLGCGRELLGCGSQQAVAGLWQSAGSCWVVAVGTQCLPQVASAYNTCLVEILYIYFWGIFSPSLIFFWY